MKNNSKKIIVLIGILLILGVILIFSFENQSFFKEEKIILPEEKQETIKKVSLLVNDGNEEIIKTVQVDFKEGITAFDLLKNESEKTNLKLRTKSYDIGVLVEAIGDVENGQGGKYWMYYVNDEMPMVSADKHQLKPGDKVEFKFEESKF